MSYPPYTARNEAEAVVCEAKALERETIAETEWLIRYIDGDGGWGPWGPDHAQYLRLREAATAIVEIAWSMQDPARDNPYAALGESIIGDAKTILTAVREFEHPPWVRASDQKS